VSTLRHTRYQAAIVRDGSLLLLRCAFRNGPTVWILPGGGREEDEDELTCVTREVREETGLTVRVDQLLADTSAEPPDGTYVRWRTYRCEVLGGNALPGGGEGPSADLVGLTWLPLRDDQSWPDEIRADPFLFPQLQVIRYNELSHPHFPLGNIRSAR
jgi:8-oxo-dGTP pyrophosphatase MutT (NUDIX family)